MTTEKLLSVAEAAKKLKLSAVRVRQLCQQGRIGEKVGKNYVLTASEVEAFSRLDRQNGKPEKNIRNVG